MNEIANIIRTYLENNRCLVIPGLGAFIKKAGDQIIFTGLLNTDDGVLRGLLVNDSRDEVVAASMINHLVFDIRHDINESGISQIGDFCILRRGVDGIIRIDQLLERQEPEAEEKSPVQDTQKPVYPVKTVEEKPAVVEEPKVEIKAPEEPVAEAKRPMETMETSEETPKKADAPRPKRRPKKSSNTFIYVILILILAIISFIAYTFLTTPSAEDLAHDDQEMEALRIENLNISE